MLSACFPICFCRARELAIAFVVAVRQWAAEPSDFHMKNIDYMSIEEERDKLA